MTIKEAINYGIEKLGDIEDKFLKIRILLSFYLNVDKNYLIIHENKILSEKQENEFKIGIDKLANSVPVQYITGVQEFYGRKFVVNENVLIPRYDTEVLIEQVLKVAKPGQKVLDMCTGSGIIAITIEKNVENLEVYASDISSDALKVAEKNAKIHSSKVKFIQSNLFENIQEKDFDIIVSNPPYINKEDMLQLDEQVKKEPETALYGGKDGLEFYRNITEKSYNFLKNRGCLFFEIGYNQRKEVSEILEKNSFRNIECIKDLYGLDRVVYGIKE